MNEPWPYNLPIFRRAYRATSPDGLVVAEIGRAGEVSMGNPTIGTLRLSSGLELPGCSPSFLWSDDSRYLAIPKYFMRFGVVRRQRLAVIDVVARSVVVSRQVGHYFQIESFSGGVLTVIREPFRHSGEPMNWTVPKDLAGFKAIDVDWSKTAQSDDVTLDHG